MLGKGYMQQFVQTWILYQIALSVRVTVTLLTKITKSAD